MSTPGLQLYTAIALRDASAVAREGLSGAFSGKPHVCLYSDMMASVTRSRQRYEADVLVLQVDSASLGSSLPGPHREALEEALLRRRDSRSWRNISWRESLKIAGRCTFSGVIHEKSLRVVAYAPIMGAAIEVDRSLPEWVRFMSGDKTLDLHAPRPRRLAA